MLGLIYVDKRKMTEMLTNVYVVVNEKMKKLNVF